MKHEEQFDELGRRKLAERGFTFDEAHWEGMQAALDAQRKRRPAAWFWAAALLLIGGGALWYGSAEDGAVVGAHTSPSAGETKGPAGSTTEPSSAAVQVEPTAPAPVSAEAMKEPTGTRAEASEASGPKALNTATPEAGPVPGSANERHVAPAQPPAREHIADDEQPAALAIGAEHPMEGGTGAADTTLATADAQKQSVIKGNAEERPSGAVVVAPEAAQPSNVAPPATPLDTNPLNEVATSSVALSDMADSAVTAAVPSPDSSVAAGPIQQPPSKRPLPLEATLWAGPSWTHNTYSGGNSTEWINGVSGEQTWDAGGELMVMRRNFGFGLGAHYATYKERFSQDEVLHQQQELRNSYFFNTVDTTVTIVIDTILQNDTTYYVTQQVNTTLNVLDWTTDTTITTTREREAIATRNVVSYLEIPLLLDAHLNQGRWNIGLRGGPTLGILTSQRGPLPGSNDEAPARFTEMVFGYTARAYVRYGISPAWSIGVEPGLRGHFGNAMGAGEVTRNNRTMGVMLGLTYRFR